MSHFMVLVIGEDVEAQMAPFQENNEGTCPAEYLAFHDKTAEVESEWQGLSDEERAAFEGIAGFAQVGLDLQVREESGEKRFGFLDNPNAKWDWYQIGGRWSGALPLRIGGKSNSALKRDIDWNRLGETAALRARLDFARWKAALDQHPDAPRPRSWDEIRKQFDSDIEAASGLSRAAAVERAREAYASQPAVATWIKLVDALACQSTEPVGDYGFDADAYIAKVRRLDVAPHAFLHEGQWRERGRMGLFAIVVDSKPPLEWCDEWERFWQSLPPDARVTVVDCHI